jgi:type IV secretory pathway VirB10-like protein
MGRNPFAQKAAAKPAPATETKKKTPVQEPEEEEIIETAPETNGILRNAVLHAAVKLPADLFVLAVKTHALIESFLEK